MFALRADPDSESVAIDRVRPGDLSVAMAFHSMRWLDEVELVPTLASYRLLHLMATWGVRGR
jgi:hypothetical protein